MLEKRQPVDSEISCQKEWSKQHQGKKKYTERVWWHTISHQERDRFLRNTAYNNFSNSKFLKPTNYN